MIETIAGFAGIISMCIFLFLIIAVMMVGLDK
jgi:hypothetical protein